MPCVLIVDDEPAVIEMISCALEARHFEIVSANHGRDGLLRLEEKLPDLIITDLVMPGMNGLDFSRVVKADERFQNIPLIIVTSATDGTELADGFWRIGTPADAFVSKPFDPFELADRVEQMIRDWNKTESDTEEDEQVRQQG